MQPLLNLRLSARAALVTADTACAALGVDTETVTSMVDTGDLIWVWDVSARQRDIRELRFWTAELADRSVSSLSVQAAITAIIPAHRDRLRAAETAMLLRISDPHLHRLVQLDHLTGPRIGHTQWITTASLTHFLRQRLIS